MKDMRLAPYRDAAIVLPKPIDENLIAKELEELDALADAQRRCQRLHDTFTGIAMILIVLSIGGTIQWGPLVLGVVLTVALPCARAARHFHVSASKAQREQQRYWQNSLLSAETRQEARDLRRCVREWNTNLPAVREAIERRGGGAALLNAREALIVRIEALRKETSLIERCRAGKSLPPGAIIKDGPIRTV